MVYNATAGHFDGQEARERINEQKQLPIPAAWKQQLLRNC